MKTEKAGNYEAKSKSKNPSSNNKISDAKLYSIKSEN
jgi:hypothetical protein